MSEKLPIPYINPVQKIVRSIDELALSTGITISEPEIEGNKIIIALTNNTNLTASRDFALGLQNIINLDHQLGVTTEVVTNEYAGYDIVVTLK